MKNTLNGKRPFGRKQSSGVSEEDYTLTVITTFTTPSMFPPQEKGATRVMTIQGCPGTGPSCPPKWGLGWEPDW